MNIGRYVTLFVRAYILVLVLVGIFTILWFVLTTVRAPTVVAGLWFAVAGFGTLIIAIIVIVEMARK